VKPVFCSRVEIELLLLFFVSFGDLKKLGGFFYFNINYVCMYVCVGMCMYVLCMCLYVFIMYVCMYVCVYVLCVYVCV